MFFGIVDGVAFLVDQMTFPIADIACGEQDRGQGEHQLVVAGKFHQGIPGEGDTFIDIPVNAVVFPLHLINLRNEVIDPLFPLVGVAEQLVDGYAEVIGNGGDQIHVREASAGLPAGHGLGGDAQGFRQRFLGPLAPSAELADIISKF